MNIKKVINKKGWSVSALAAEMPNRDGTKGIKQSSMSRIINGDSEHYVVVIAKNDMGC